MSIIKLPHLRRTVALSIFFLSVVAYSASARQAYIPIVPAQPSDSPGKVEVLEFFSYTCGPCSTMEPFVERWAKTAPPDVLLRRVPVAFNAAIYLERKRLFDRKSMAEWVVTQGVDRARFEAAFESFHVQVQVQRASQLADAYRLNGTPSIAVGGKFMTSPAMAGNGYEGAIREIELLIPLARD